MVPCLRFRGWPVIRKLSFAPQIQPSPDIEMASHSAANLCAVSDQSRVDALIPIHAPPCGNLLCAQRIRENRKLIGLAA